MACSSSFLSKVKNLIELKDANGLSGVKDELLKEISSFSTASEDELRARLVSSRNLDIIKDDLAGFSIPAAMKDKKFAALK